MSVGLTHHFRVVLACSLLMSTVPLRSQISLSQLVVELDRRHDQAVDVEVRNDSQERSFVSIEPREILRAGQANEVGAPITDPRAAGLLVSPLRLVLEPHQTRLVRMGLIGPTSQGERVYRVTVKPVTGDLKADQTGLKLLVGYDLLVLSRPAIPQPKVRGARAERQLRIENTGNVSVEIVGGKQCAAGVCHDLPSKRLYAGVNWMQTLPEAAPISYRMRVNDMWSELRF